MTNSDRVPYPSNTVETLFTGWLPAREAVFGFLTTRNLKVSPFSVKSEAVLEEPAHLSDST